jgi:ribosomal protein L40E
MEEREDYETKMKRQYDQVVTKFRDLAKKDLGATFTETEFQAWWATQATFITFDQWLKEEEEQKRMGSKPCPACGMDNSVTAKICHKCGSLMEEEEIPPKKEKPPEAKPAEKPVEPAPVEAPAAVAPAAVTPAVVPKKVEEAPAAVPPEKKKCPSCGMEVGVAEKTCPICNYNFEDKPPETPPEAAPETTTPVKRVVRKPVKKVVRRPVQKE